MLTCWQSTLLCQYVSGLRFSNDIGKNGFLLLDKVSDVQTRKSRRFLSVSLSLYSRISDNVSLQYGIRYGGKNYGVSARNFSELPDTFINYAVSIVTGSLSFPVGIELYLNPKRDNSFQHFLAFGLLPSLSPINQKKGILSSGRGKGVEIDSKYFNRIPSANMAFYVEYHILLRKKKERSGILFGPIFYINLIPDKHILIDTKGLGYYMALQASFQFDFTKREKIKQLDVEPGSLKDMAYYLF